MDKFALAVKLSRPHIVVPGLFILVATAAIVLGWPLFSNFEAYRSGYISGVLRSGKSCAPEISPNGYERLKNYQQLGNPASFTAGFALGRKHVEQTREAAANATACHLFVARYARASETPLLIAFPSHLSEVEWPFWVFALLTGWLLLRSLASAFRNMRMLASSKAMKNWPRIFALLCLGVSAAGALTIVLQFHPQWLGIYRQYFWPDARWQAVLPTAIFGFGPLAAFIALYMPSRWIIFRRARRERGRNRVGLPIANVVPQPVRNSATQAAHHSDAIPLNAASHSTYPGNWGHYPHHQGWEPPNNGGPRQSSVRPEEHGVQVLAQRLMAAAHLNRTAQMNEYVAKRALLPPTEIIYPRLRRDLKTRSWRGLLDSIDDEAQRGLRRRR